MIILKRYGNPWHHSDLSPFCSKVETYLRMAALEYRAEVADVRKAPKQKLPYVIDGETTLCDSRDIIAHYEAARTEPMDAHLSPKQRAVSAAFRALVEEELYFHVLYLRWQEDDGWSVYEPHIRAYVRTFGVPGFLSGFVAGTVRKQVIGALRAQGTGRHSRAEVERRACEALDALSAQLGEDAYFLGDAPHTLDATTYAALDAILNVPLPRVQQLARERANLVAYDARMRQRYFPEVAHGQAPAAEQPALREMGA